MLENILLGVVQLLFVFRVLFCDCLIIHKGPKRQN